MADGQVASIRLRLFWLAFLLVACLATAASAQESEKFRPPNFGILGGGNLGDDVAANFTVSATFEMQANSRRGRIHVTAKMAPDWHIYSVTQPPGGPKRTKISVTTEGVALAGDFQPDQDPAEHLLDYYTPPLIAEEHSGEVVWTAPLKLAEGLDPRSLEIGVALEGQVCSNVCEPKNEKFTAKFTGFYKAAAATGEYRDNRTHATIRGHVAAGVVQAGDQVNLVLTAIPDEHWHVYAYEAIVPETALSKPTLIVLQRTSGWKYSAPAPSEEPHREESGLGEPKYLVYHEGPVSWTTTLQVPDDAQPGAYVLAGQIGYQVCSDKTCDMPVAATFEVAVSVAAARVAGTTPLAFAAANNYNDIATLAEQIPAATLAGVSQKQAVQLAKSKNAPSLAMTLVFALAGGLILNLMPCVLPVIGLKILSFTEQAGHGRARILALNTTYSLGLISVFLVLATLAAFMNLKWGEQFTFIEFKLTMVILVFAMALSFLGVWEIPLPGFIGSGKSNDLQAQEGLSGAFFKGVFTTILATPCSGPFLGPVFGFTLSQPPLVTYLIFGCVGLGMASPYLLVGAFPSLVRFLPKPGAWMETFKQLMGFILLGTVVYLFSTMQQDYYLATLALLVGVGFACWLVGRTSIVAPFAQKARSWSIGVATAVGIGFLAFWLLTPSDTHLDWQPYSPQALAAARAQGKTVMIDFTADWCPNCKVNLKFAINTKEVEKVINAHGIVTLLADWTEPSQEIEDALAELQSGSIPVLAVYPAKGGEPIILRDLLSQADVLGALEEAGPSQSAASGASTAQKR